MGPIDGDMSPIIAAHPLRVGASHWPVLCTNQDSAFTAFHLFPQGNMYVYRDLYIKMGNYAYIRNGYLFIYIDINIYI